MMNVTTRRWFIIVALIFGGLLLYYLSPVLKPFIIAAIIAYLANPLVELLQRWHLPRVLAVAVVFVLVIILLISLLLLLIPAIEHQAIILIGKIPATLQWIQNNLLPWLNNYWPSDLQVDFNKIADQLRQHWQQAGNVALIIIKTVTKSSFALVAFITDVLLIPVVCFYLLRDWRKLLAGIAALFPRYIEPTIVLLAKQCDEVVNAFFRGQLLVMLALGIFYSMGLSMVGIDVAILVGCLAGIMSIVPYLGFIIGLLLASIAAFWQFPDFWHLLYVFIVFGIGQTLESTVLTPILVGDKIGLHPVAVIFVILAGGQLAGFVGVLLALPVGAVIMVLVRYAKYRYLNSPLYQ